MSYLVFMVAQLPNNINILLSMLLLLVVFGYHSCCWKLLHSIISDLCSQHTTTPSLTNTHEHSHSHILDLSLSHFPFYCLHNCGIEDLRCNSAHCLIGMVLYWRMIKDKEQVQKTWRCRIIMQVQRSRVKVWRTFEVGYKDNLKAMHNYRKKSGE